VRDIEQLGGLDATFLYCETATMHLHVCGLLVLDTSTMPDGYSFEKIRTMLVDRMPRIPAGRRRLANVPLGVSRPFWIEDPDLDVDRHLHRVGVPPPGDDRALASLTGEIASRPLRRDRPLWEIWVVEGLPDDRVALIVKMHHSTIDGVSGANMLGEIFDLAPNRGRMPPKEIRQANPEPSQLELFGRGLGSHLSSPWDLVRLVPSTTAHLTSTLWRLGRQNRHDLATAAPFTAPRTLFNATITGRRSVAFSAVDLAEVKRIKAATGVTVNDVVTALIGGALRRYLDDRGELPERPLLAAAPVSVHDEADSHAGTTKLSVMFSNLATDVRDPVERLKRVAASNARSKEINKMVGADTLMRWAEHFWLNAFGLGARLYSSLHVADHHPVVHNLILSNVFGPPVPLYLAGARLVGLYPLGPITDGAGLNVTVVSQEDRIGFGFMSCPDLLPDVWDLAEAVSEDLAELSASVFPQPS
jgi:diacylglycerol O-acyltransferase / wax synthase